MSNFIEDSLSAAKLLSKKDQEIEIVVAVPIRIKQRDWSSFLHILRAKETNYSEYLAIPIAEEIKNVLKSPDLV